MTQEIKDILDTIQHCRNELPYASFERRRELLEALLLLKDALIYACEKELNRLKKGA